MKELLDFIKTYGIEPIVTTVGWFFIVLFGLSLIPSLSFVPKAFVLYVLTH